MKTLSYETIRERLLAAGNPEKARGMARFFKTGPGGYAEGDHFIGLSSPAIRRFEKECRDLPLADVARFLEDPIHELRTFALMSLVGRYHRGDEAVRGEIFRLYLAHARFLNNWDLVDISAPGIVGEETLCGDRAVLDRLASSRNLWEQRIAMVSTLTLIRHGEFGPTLGLAERFLPHPHDLIHKACGWMLREVGKRDRAALTRFLQAHKAAMPRTMLRYAIEHYPPGERKAFLARDPANSGH